MKRVNATLVTLWLLAVLVVLAGLLPQKVSGEVIRIPDGTPVQLALQEGLNSATAHAGDSIHFEVAEDVRVANGVVISTGAPGIGRVVDADHKKRMGRGGKLNFSVNYVKLADGTNCKVRASAARQGKDKTGTVIAGTVLLSPLFLLMHGKDIDIPKGTAFTAYIDGDYDLAAEGAPPQVLGGVAQPKPIVPPQPAVAPPPASVSATPVTAPEPSADAAGASAAVSLKSTPDGADISIDGEFVGSTPTSLRLKPGHHAIAVRKTGFKPWQRNLNVQPDATITIQADLEKGS